MEATLWQAHITARLTVRRELDAGERRTFWACFGGWMLDAMDVQIFSFVIPAIIVAFAITNGDAGLIGTVTLLTSAFGGWFGGLFPIVLGACVRCKSRSPGSPPSRFCAASRKTTYSFSFSAH